MNRWYSALVVGLTLVGCQEYELKGDQVNLGLAQPVIQVTPQQLGFGQVGAGDNLAQYFQIENVGDATLELDVVYMQASPAFTLATDASDMDLGPGDTVDAMVSYSPINDADVGTVFIPSNDPVTPLAEVDLTGGLGVPALSVDPLAIDFGWVQVGDTVLESVQVTNTGTAPANLTDVFTSDLVFDVANFVPGSLNPGASTTLDLTFTPSDAIPYAGTANIASDLPDLVVSLTGNGALPPSAVCEASVPLALIGEEIAWIGNQSSDPAGLVLEYDWILAGAPAGSSVPMPAGPVTDPDRYGFYPDLPGTYTGELTVTNSLGLQDTCTIDVAASDVVQPVAICSVTPNPVQAIYGNADLIGSASYDPAGLPLTYAWTGVGRPAGSAVTVPGGAPTDPNRYGFTPDMVGFYDFELVVTSSLGVASDPCYTSLEAIPAEDLWVEMFWATGGDDMDLHVTRAGGALTTNQDCYYGNCKTGLAWGPAGSDGDPILDLDNIGGTGPENINVQAPENLIYNVFVHDYPGSNYTPANNVTVNIYLSGALAWTDTIAISGEDQYVHFADVDWAAQTVTP